MRLWQSTTQRMLGGDAEPVIEPDRGDRRFKDAAWNENALFDFIKQSYLLSRALPAGSRARTTGWTTRPRRRSISTRASSSMRWRRRTSSLTNPEVLRQTIESARREPAARA